jgi:hypothetical protein
VLSAVVHGADAKDEARSGEEGGIATYQLSLCILIIILEFRFILVV